MGNQQCMIIPNVVDINSIDPLFYRYSVTVNICSGCHNNSNNLYAFLILLKT